MRRRLATILSAAMLSTALLLPMTAVAAVGAETAVVLAAEGHGSTSGLDPMDADNEENEFAPAPYEANWTWRAGKVLLAAFLVALVYIGAMYYLRVSRPARTTKS